MARPWPAFLLLAAACVTGSGLGKYGDDTGGDGEGPVQILSIDPAWGPPGAETAVTITGVGFEGHVSVEFGAQALSVTQLDDETLLVTAPALGLEAAVDVVVTSDLGMAVEEDGFTYTNTAPEGDADTDADTDADVTPTGLTGGLVQFSRSQVACPSCIGYVNEFVVYAAASLHTPVSGTWNDHLPASGTCAANSATPPLSTDSYDVGSFAYLQSGARSVPLPRITDSSGSYYENPNLSELDYVSQQAWDLSAPGAGSVPTIDLQDVVITPYGFDTITPVNLLQTAAGSPFSQPIDATTNNLFTWSPTGAGFFVVLLDVYSSDGSTYLGGITCRGPDSGSMTVPGSQLLAYPPYSLLVVYLIRYETKDTVLPHNGATVNGVGQASVIGTAVLY